MEGFLENRYLLYSLVACFAMAFGCVLEVFPEGNKYLELVPMPSRDFQMLLLGAMLVDFFGAFAWDRLVVGVVGLVRRPRR